MKRLFTAGAALLLLGCDLHHNRSEHVELLLNPSPPGPATTFELRFDQPMAGPEKIGRPAEPSPLVIEPALGGVFTWLSPRSGAFVPSEPLALERRYELSLRSGLAGADGRPSAALLRQRVQMPPFAMVDSIPQSNQRDLSSEEVVTLVFNAPVAAADLAPYIEFRDASGDLRAAEIEQGTNEDVPGNYRRWDLPATLVSNSVLAAPKQPLPAGKDWHLVLRPGLPAVEKGLRLRARAEIPLGEVRPFVFTEAIAHHFIQGGASIVLQFSKPVDPALADEWSRWIQLKPVASNITAEIEGRCLSLRGDFQSGTCYQLAVNTGFPAEESFTLDHGALTNIIMPGIPPRLYFAAFSEDQQAVGRRQFPLLAVNVPTIRLRAKLLESETAIYALRGYERYFRSWPGEDRHGEQFRRVDYNLIAGRTIFDEEVAAAPQSDFATNLMLDWDRVLGGRKTGVIFVEAECAGERDESNSRLGTQALMQLTDLGLAWKSAGAELDAFVFSQSTGKPVAGAALRLFDDENQVLQEALTDARGLAHLKCPTNAQWLAAALGRDFHALKIEDHGIPLYGFDLPQYWGGAGAQARSVLLFSDREYYRPNETLHLKALARDWTNNNLGIPSELTGTLECFDARGKAFFSNNVQFNGRGACAVDVPLLAGPCGDYVARLHLGDASSEHAFQVRELQPNPFEVTVRAKSEYAAGDKVEIPVSARYYFGQPLSRARVKWTMEMEESDFKPPGFDSFRFRRAAPGGHLAFSGEARLSNSPGCVITPEMPSNNAAPGPRLVSLLVETTDLDQQTVSSSAQFTCHSSDFYLGLCQTDSVWTAGQASPRLIVAVGADGQPWPQAVAAHLQLQRVDWQPLRVQGAGSTIRYVPQSVHSNVLERDIEIRGLTQQLLSAAEPGQYALEVSATDAHGRKVASSIEFTVSAPGNLGWNYRDEVRMELQPDRSEYAPGETARLLVKAPFSGVAWVTVERDKVLRFFSARLDGNAPVIEIPIGRGDLPNVFVSVLLTRGSEDCPREVKEPEYRIGYCQLPVRDPASRLAVSVVCAATNYLPAQPVEVTVNVNDISNACVAGAEVTLYAVDEGVLSLGDPGLPDPGAVFYAARPLSVSSGISLPNLLAEDLEPRRYANKGYVGGGGGRCRVRKNFLACAFWNATLVTGPEGSVTAKFLAPDSLTRYRVMAVAHLDDRFGSGQSAFEVSKPLLIEPALPQFAHVGDQLMARAVIHNQSPHAGEVVVKLELDDKARANSTVSHVQIAAGGSEVAEFPVTFAAAGPAKWIWRAWFADAPREFTDSTECALEVGYVLPLLHQTLLESVNGLATNLFAGANPQVLAGTGTVTIRVSNTRLSELGGAVSHLLHYPYGCAEQTGSSMLPWIVLSDAPALRSVMGCRSNEIEHAIHAGVERLFTMQTPDGGLGYWPHAREPMLWASAYGAMVLTLAQQHGCTLPEPEFEYLLSGLSAQLREPDGDERSLSDMCLALYALALAGRAEPAYHEKLFSRRGQLSTEDRALLALAVLQANGPPDMARELLMTNRTSRRAAPEHFDCPSRAMAIRLLAWMRLQPESRAVPALVEALMGGQREAHWGTTQDNAWALLALTEYARRIEGSLQPAAGELRWRGKTMPFRLDAGQPLFDNTFVLTGAAESPPSLLNASPHRLYASVAFEIRPPGAAQPRQDGGFGLQRRYQRLDGDNQPCGGALAVGDRVLVTLELSAREAAQYVVVDDSLPAILEPVSSGLGGGEEQDWEWDFHEFRKDRALFFANDLPAGDYTLRYCARVRAAGEAGAPSGKVEEMYHPQRFGLTGTQILEGR
jgi:alpha-2-macroglobulin